MSHTQQIVASEFASEVLDAATPVLVDFYATWCPPCKMLAPILDQMSGEFAGRVKILKVNVDEEPALAGAFRIESVPTLIAFHEGKMVNRTPGAPGASALRSFLEQLAQLGQTAAPTSTQTHVR
jgi:thioredoxin 1